MERNSSITKEMIDYYDYGNVSMEAQLVLLAMSHIEYKIGKVVLDHNQDKGCPSAESLLDEVGCAVIGDF